jgi:hypothetical protein
MLWELRDGKNTDTYQRRNNMATKKSTVNAAGNYTKPTMRKALVASVKAGTKGGDAGEWSARKAQLVAKKYKAAGGGYKWSLLRSL